MTLEDLILPDKGDWWNVRAVLEEWAFKLVNSQRFTLPGTVALFAKNSPPDGWVECDNASYEITKFQDLYDAIGTTHGGSGTEFNVPSEPYVAPANFVWMIKT